MYTKRSRSSPVVQNPEKKPNLNLSDSFASAVSGLDSSSTESLNSTTTMHTSMDQDIGLAPDIVSLICVEVNEMNGEELKSPALNIYDAILLYRHA